MAPSHALASREGAAKRCTGCARAGLLSLEIGKVQGADAVVDSGRQYRWRRYRESSCGPCAVGEPVHARDLSCARTGRSRGRPRLLVMPVGGFAGWQSRGGPRGER